MSFISSFMWNSMRLHAPFEKERLLDHLESWSTSFRQRTVDLVS